MTEHQKETAFLKQMIVFDDTEEGRKLRARISQAQCDEHCVKRAAGLMILLAALGAAGLAYGTVLQENFSAGTSHLIIRILCEIGLASLISLFALSGLLMVYRRKLNRFREECRRLVEKTLESRLGNPHLARDYSRTGAQPATQNSQNSDDHKNPVGFTQDHQAGTASR